MIHQKTHTSQEKKQKKHPNLGNFDKKLTNEEVISLLLSYREYEQDIVNRIGELLNRDDQADPSQNDLAGWNVARETANRFLNNEKSYPVIRKYNRYSRGVYQYTCLYRLHRALYHHEVREKLKHIFPFMNELCRYHLMSIFNQGRSSVESSEWDYVTTSITNDVFLIAQLNMQYGNHEKRPHNQHAPPEYDIADPDIKPPRDP